MIESVSGRLVAVRPREGAQVPSGPVGFDALYAAQWWPMIRLAQGLVDDVSSAEDVVQDAFSGLYRNQRALRDQAAAIGYLRTSVVNNARSVLRRRRTVRAKLGLVRANANEHAPAADEQSLRSVEHDRARAALAGLADRQREVLTLRFLGDLSDTEIAQATGLSAGAVRSSASRGLSALRATLGGRS